MIFGFGHPPVIRAPEPTETSIELPWHLAISPVAGSQWSHPTDPITANGSTELWRTRLAKSANPNSGDGGSLRAIWNFDTQTRYVRVTGTADAEGRGAAGERARSVPDLPHPKRSLSDRQVDERLRALGPGRHRREEAVADIARGVPRLRCRVGRPDAVARRVEAPGDAGPRPIREGCQQGLPVPVRPPRRRRSP